MSNTNEDEFKHRDKQSKKRNKIQSPGISKMEIHLNNHAKTQEHNHIYLEDPCTAIEQKKPEKYKAASDLHYIINSL